MTPAVEVGQIWRDNDKRMSNRHIQVLRIDGERAVCQRMIWNHPEQMWVANPFATPTKIAVRRFRPTATGYALVWPNPGGAA